MRLLLLRHAETILNQDHRVQGLSQADLTPLGLDQACALTEALKEERLEAIYSSPLARALQTARAIAAARGIAVQEVDPLKEADAGKMEGLPASELSTVYPDFMARWPVDATAAMPGGESLQQVQDRVWPFLGGLPEQHQDQTIAVVTHNFVIQVLIARMLSMPTVAALKLRIGLASISEVDWSNGRWTLVRLSDACHLGNLPPLT
jgi:broad specificity phosphatase PhoE